MVFIILNLFIYLFILCSKLMRKLIHKPDSSGSVATTSSVCLLSTITNKRSVESYTQCVNNFVFIPHQPPNQISIKQKGRLKLQNNQLG